MGKAITYRNYVSDDRDAIISLLSEGREPQFKKVKSEIFDWQYGSNPHGNGQMPIVVGIVGENIVSVNGTMPIHLRYHNERRRGIWSCDTFVTVRFRGCGFSKGMKALISESADVIMAYGISDMNDPILSRLGWEPCPDVREFFYFSAEHGLPGVLKNMATRILQFLGRFRCPADVMRYEVMTSEEGGDFGREVDELWSRSAGSYERTVERDAAYLSWKYRRHPLNKYTTYEARRKGRLEGLLIARPSKKESVIVDYCGPAKATDLKLALVKEAVRDILTRGTVRIRCVTSDSEIMNALRLCGFGRYSKEPVRFRVRSNIPGDSCWTRGFFLMTGDSDNDFLAEM